jgi:hypothetical protein
MYTQRPLYIREHLASKETTLEEFMRSDRLREMYIAGAPGCGKTTFVAYWARRFAAKNSKRVLLVNYHENRESSIFAADGTFLYKFNTVLYESNVFNTLEGILTDENERFDLCIFDGVRQSNQVCKNLLSIINAHTGKTMKIGKSMHVTSLSFVLRGGDVDLGYKTEISRLFFDSWNRDDYVEAFENFSSRRVIHDDLKEDIKKMTAGAASQDVARIDRQHMNSNEGDMVTVDSGDQAAVTDAMIEEYVDLKYYLGGGSARLMFDFTYDDVEKFLTIETERVSDWKQFTRTSIAARSADSVNTLMQRFTSNDIVQKCTPLSRYVLMKAYENCQAELVDAVKSVADACCNPALQGWAFELQQLELIRLAVKANSEAPRTYLSAANFSYVPLNEGQYDGEQLQADTLENVGGVIWCLKWNQGCFDVAFYSNRTLVTIQFTVVEEDSLKLEYVKKLRDALRSKNKTMETVVHVVVVDGSFNYFKFKPPSGTGRSSKSGAEVEFEVSVCKSSKLVLKDFGPIKEDLSFQEIQKIPIYSMKRKATG